MGYVAVKGGTAAIEESIRRLKYERLKKGTVLKVRDIEGGMRGLIDQIMSEGSLYDETLAALAIKQAEGSPEEAVFLLRAYRSTLPRKHYARTIRTERMAVERRISASFKDIPGGQILGATYDFTHRLIDFELMEETEETARAWLREFAESVGDAGSGGMNDGMAERGDASGGAAVFGGASGGSAGGGPDAGALDGLPKVSDYLRKEGLLPDCEEDNREPDDVTRRSLTFPSTRSQRLQVLTRGQTGAMTSLAYAVIRGYDVVHPTVGELRVGHLPVYIADPVGSEDSDAAGSQADPSGESDDDYYIGNVKATEAEMLIPVVTEKVRGKKELEFQIGYGLCYGQNETKAIAMGILDYCLEAKKPGVPTHDEEFVLLHIDSVESTGFISHLKMPHYVTFQSKLDSVRRTKRTTGNANDGERTGAAMEVIRS